MRSTGGSSPGGAGSLMSGSVRLLAAAKGSPAVGAGAVAGALGISSFFFSATFSSFLSSDFFLSLSLSLSLFSLLSRLSRSLSRSLSLLESRSSRGRPPERPRLFDLRLLRSESVYGKNK